MCPIRSSDCLSRRSYRSYGDTPLTLQQLSYLLWAGLEPGAYHYLPMEHALELLGAVEAMSETISDALLEQKWAARAGVVFFWSVVPYRAEWRYGIRAQRTILIDVGHVGQNHYLAATALGLGTCTVAAFDDPLCSRLFGLDGKEEFIIYAVPVGSRGRGGAPHCTPKGQ